MDNKNAVLGVKQMSHADQLAVVSGVSAIELMKNAGEAVAREIVSRWSIRPVLVLCGPGNNGGDGFVVANSLNQSGWPVRLTMLGSRDQLKGEAKYHADQWLGPIEPLSTDVLDGASLIVDAVFGAGFKGSRENPVMDLFSELGRRHLEIVAIDVPTGLVGDTGEVIGTAPAKLTVTFFRKKPGHLLMPGKSYCGEVVVADIGIPGSVWKEIVPTVFENAPSLWINDLPRPNALQHKYDRGHALVYGGYPMTGAARLAALAAARAGAGLTTIAVPEIAFSIYATAMTSVMIKPFDNVVALEAMLDDKRITAFLIGPGAGTSEETRKRVLSILSKKKLTVLDADAISSFRDDPNSLIKAIQENGQCVLTPHEGEFSRIFACEGSKLERCQRAAQLCGAVVLLKGSDTVIASPRGDAIVNSNAPPTLATAGSGDVLSGILLGLLAQGMDPFAAACAATWLHGEAANSFGPGLIADDLPGLVPSALQKLL